MIAGSQFREYLLAATPGERGGEGGREEVFIIDVLSL